MASSRRRMTRADLQALADFRYQLRRFLRFSEEAARLEGLTPLQYQLLLQIAGFPGRPWALVGELADRLQMAPHGVVALVSRCERAHFLERRRSSTDRRQVEVHLAPEGAAVVARVAARNWPELQSLSSVFRVARMAAFNDSD